MSRPMYQKIYDELLQSIESGAYLPGDRLPSEKELSETYSVSRITSKKALEMLAEKSYITRMPGKGSFVGRPEGEAASGAEQGGAAPLKIGVVAEGLGHEFSLNLFLSLTRYSEQNGCFIIPRLTNGIKDVEEEMIRQLLDLGVDGIILMSSHGENINFSVLKMVLDRIPLVLVDRYLRAIPAPFVGTDNVQSTVEATGYLLDLGHRNISYLTRPYNGTVNLEDRVMGFVRSHAEHGVAIDESKWITDIESIMPNNKSPETVARDIQKIKNLIINHPDVTCFFTSEFSIAQLAEHAVQELGLRVPDDISILSFDGYEDFSGYCFFTRVIQKEQAIAYKAIDLLLEQLRNKTNNSGQKIFFKADLIISKSTAAPKKR